MAPSDPVPIDLSDVCTTDDGLQRSKLAAARRATLTYDPGPTSGTGPLSVWFDEEGDSLEVTLDRETGYFNDLGNGVFERVDEDGRVIGFAIRNVDDRTDHELPFDAEFRRVTS